MADTATLQIPRPKRTSVIPNPTLIKKRLPVVCYGSTRPVTSLQFTRSLPSEENAFYLICSSKDNIAMLRDGRSGDWIGTFNGHKGAVWSAVLDSSASLALTASADFTAKLWDACRGTLLGTVPHRHVVRATAFCGEDEDVIAIGGQDGALRIWDMRGWAQIHEHTYSNSVKSILWLPGSQKVLVNANDEAKLSVLDPRTGKPERDLRVCQQGKITKISLSSCGQVLVAAHGNQVSLIDARTLEPYSEHPVFTHSSGVNCAAIHVPSKLLVISAVGSQDSQLIDITTGETKFVGRGHTGPIQGLDFAPDGKMFASGAEDGTIRMWPTHPTEEYGIWAVRPMSVQAATNRGSPMTAGFRRTPSPGPFLVSQRPTTPLSQPPITQARPPTPTGNRSVPASAFARSATPNSHAAGGMTITRSTTPLQDTSTYSPSGGPTQTFHQARSRTPVGSGSIRRSISGQVQPLEVPQSEDHRNRRRID